MKKFAVILSGCGVFDGSEIHEATLSLLAIMKNGANYEVFAPDRPQHHVINHVSGEEMAEERNILVESARIARGDIKPLQEYKAVNFDALLIPGGFGAAKNLSSFAFKGSGMDVEPDIIEAITTTVDAEKPIGALCISPVILAKLFKGAKLTIGQDEETMGAVNEMGATHIATTHGEVIIDEKHKIFTTPCYMLDANILQIDEGANNLVTAMLKIM